MSLNNTTLKKFYNTAWDRHRIYVLKELGIQKPWTKNPIFLDYRFCNVFRDLDKTSVWIINNAIKPNEGNPSLWKTIFMCRYISRISTLKILQEGNALCDNQRAAYSILRAMQVDGDKIFTDAFIVNSKTSSGWKDKVTYLFEMLKNIHYLMSTQSDTIIRCTNTMEDLYNILKRLPGVGPFMAYQYTVDFTYSSRYLSKAWDKRTWTQLGLGAVRGMNRLLYDKPSRNKIPMAIEFSNEIFDLWKKEIGKNLKSEIEKTDKIILDRWIHPDPPPEREITEFLYERFNLITLMDVEHWLCEYDKYMRGGSKKRRYYGNA